MASSPACFHGEKFGTERLPGLKSGLPSSVDRRGHVTDQRIPAGCTCVSTVDYFVNGGGVLVVPFRFRSFTHPPAPPGGRPHAAGSRVGLRPLLLLHSAGVLETPPPLSTLVLRLPMTRFFCSSSPLTSTSSLYGILPTSCPWSSVNLSPVLPSRLRLVFVAFCSAQLMARL